MKHVVMLYVKYSLSSTNTLKVENKGVHGRRPHDGHIRNIPVTVTAVRIYTRLCTAVQEKSHGVALQGEEEWNINERRKEKEEGGKYKVKGFCTGYHY